MDRINVILSIYNGEKYIREQVDSILNNNYKNLVIYAYDDGSKDSSVNIMKEYSRNYPDKIVFKENAKNKGCVSNFLEGVKEIDDTKTNDYFMFCDQDDVWMDNKIERTRKAMKALEKKYGTTMPLAVFSDVLVVDDTLNVLSPSFFQTSNLNPQKIDINHLLMENKLIGCTIMFNQALKEKLNHIPQKPRVHDWWVALIAASFGHVGFVNEPTMYYRQHGGNVIGSKNYLSYIKSSIKNLRSQKEALDKTILQAREFYLIHGKDLSPKTKEIIYIFSRLNEYNWFNRRKNLLLFGYFKTGLIRNIGLFIII